MNANSPLTDAPKAVTATMMTSAMRVLNRCRAVVVTSVKPKPARCAACAKTHVRAPDYGLDAGLDGVEQAAELGTEGLDSNDDDNRNQSNHEAVLDGGGASIAAHCGDLDLKLDESREHVGPLLGL
jgi:hypothetical protein